MCGSLEKNFSFSTRSPVLSKKSVLHLRVKSNTLLQNENLNHTSQIWRKEKLKIFIDLY